MRGVGIDKIHGYLPPGAYNIKDWSKTEFTVQPPVFRAGQELQRGYLGDDSTGYSQPGAKAWFNDPDGLYAININSMGLQVIYNPSKKWHPYNLCDDIDTFVNRSNLVFGSLVERGITADWEQMRLTRIDLTKQAMLKNPMSKYAPILSSLQLPRSKNPKMFPDGFSSHKREVGVNIYNKGKEMREAGIKADYLGDNLCRLEMQFKTNRGIIKRVGMGYLGDVYDYGFNHLNDIYHTTVKQDVFKGDSLVTQLDIENENQIMRSLIEQFPNYITQYEKLVGGVEVIKRHGSIDGYIDFLRLHQIETNGKENRSVLNKKRRELTRLQHQRAFIFKNEDSSKLYRELYTKLVA